MNLLTTVIKVSRSDVLISGGKQKGEVKGGRLETGGKSTATKQGGAKHLLSHGGVGGKEEKMGFCGKESHDLP